jgi:hypothetical protein
MLQCMGGKYGLMPPEGMAARILRINEKWYVLAAALGLVFLAPSTHELMKKRLALDIVKNVEPVYSANIRWLPSQRWACGVALMAVLSLLLLTKVNAFIYFQF